MKNTDRKCPCGNKKSYSDCCKRFHKGGLPNTALELMRSRYSAYALGLGRYIIETSHPQNPEYSKNTANWLKEIETFSQETQFNKLEILDFQESENEATVTFIAHLSQNKKEVSFKEKSLFKKEKGRWLYVHPI